MKDIIYCPTEADFDYYLEEVENQKVLPHCGIIINYPGSLYEELDGLWPVARLNQIKQLGLATKCIETFFGSNSRYAHSISFAAKIDHISQTLGLDRELAVSTAMLHDIATTPFSDSLSHAFGIDDERHFLGVLESWPDALNYLERHGIEKERVAMLVRGEDSSPLGQLINSRDSIDVDRWSYTVCDASPFFRLPVKGGYSLTIDPFDGVSVIDGRVVFNDTGTVGQFLEMRTKLSERVYRNGLLMAKEAFIPRLVGDLKDKGLIDTRSIMHMTDDDFERLAITEGGEIGERLFMDLKGFADYGILNANPDAMKQELSKLVETPFEVVRHKSFNPAIGTPMLSGGKVVPYFQLERWHATRLEERMQALARTHVYGYENDEKLATAVTNVQKRFIA